MSVDWKTGVRGMAVDRTHVLIPPLGALVALAVMWQLILNGQQGVLIGLLSRAHIKGPNWLGDPFWAKFSMVLMAVWGIGNAMVIYLAGLQDVPAQLYEAAELDGASW